ncbi:acyltransferase family protein [Novosphingobium sp. G106]|uniref:acyltransferase family protein n=1 Tax=Novosphingobium sp. G106 TaxID=2849500 RepID=UPI001C2CCE7F|nr:acyltransferase family protein [Novosphingobium sp. G106]MBV1691243.1 acyltransferase family protein [Novosphingobium sp. G106]
MSTLEDTNSIEWANVAKAACACLVVLMHGEAQIQMAGWGQQSKLMEIWHTINEFIRPIRMPTFFLISGMLAAKFVLHDRDDADRRCFVRPFYLYALWAAILMTLVPNFPATDPAMALPDRLYKILFIGSPAWFMYGLGIFYLITKVTRSLPAGPVLTACALVSMAGSIWSPDNTLYAAKLLRCLFFFVAGVRLRGAVIGFASTASPYRWAALFGLYALGAVITMSLGTYSIAVDIAAVAFSLTTWSLVCRNLGTLSAPVQWVGRRTLFVYLLHFPLICLLSYLVNLWADPEILENFWLGLAYPVVTVVLIVPLTLALGILLQRLGFDLLFDLPTTKSATPRPGRSGPLST